MNPTIFDTPEARALFAATPVDPSPKARLDAAAAHDRLIADSAANFAAQSLSMSAAATVQAWAEDSEMDEGEGAADRLIAMLVGIADENKDGELSADEQEIVDAAANEAWDYLSAKGAADSDLEALFNSEDPTEANAAGERIRDLIADALPEGDAADDEIDDFAFGTEASEGVFDAVYKKRFAVRKGKKVMVRKRVAGHVRLSARQKVAIRKAGMKARGSRAMAKRKKSLRVRKSLGL